MADSLTGQELARNLACDILRGKPIVSLADIELAAHAAAAAIGAVPNKGSVDAARLVAELRHLFSVTIEMATALDGDKKEHHPWLDERLGTDIWKLWGRYATYLERDFGMPELVVQNLDAVTRMVLERLEDPQRQGAWDRRGMVVGSVQSGKTANYTGLICKAIDAGYKLVVVLAGTHSNLRSQTQLRLDEGVLGFDTQKGRNLNYAHSWIGVGKLPGPRPVVHSLTSSADNGDFNKKVADTVGVMLGSDPVLLVIKKNSYVLGNLINWILHVSGISSDADKLHAVKNIPLLLIDDEADNASINTKAKKYAKPGDPDSDTVTAINGKIRELLNAFEKSSYVGYTATPFANIFINPDAESTKAGEDLFPRSFIINVKPPSNYVGPERVFGVDGDVDADIPSGEGLPIVERITDYEASFPEKHKSDFPASTLPDSLSRAIRCFVLTCAARRARGQREVHNSMLVHVTRFVKVQERVSALIAGEVATLEKRLRLGDGKRSPTLRSELETLWNETFVPTIAELSGEGNEVVSWGDVDRELHPAAAKIAVLPINGLAKEALDYKEYRHIGRSVIAVGGDKLSRGLTLEGLSISYFLRTSRMYDTLMQMGRWFGYRPGYLDLCRLFTTTKLVRWYRYIALAEIELRREFDYMVGAGLTPATYGLRVRTHPQGMLVTAINKMSHGKTLTLSWEGTLVQTSQFPKEESQLAQNFDAVTQFIARRPAAVSHDASGKLVWHGVPSSEVAALIGGLKFPPAAARASGASLAAYIRNQCDKATPELTEWTVALISRASGKQAQFGSYQVACIERAAEDQTPSSVTMTKANILDPTHEALDFAAGPTGTPRSFDRDWYDQICTKEELKDETPWLEDMIGAPALEVALELTKRWQADPARKMRAPKSGETSRPNGRVLRILRPVSRGMLMIYPIVRPETIVTKVDGKDVTLKTGWKADAPPLIGIALSFPTSNTAIGAEYKANMVWRDEMEDDAAYED